VHLSPEGKKKAWRNIVNSTKEGTIILCGNDDFHEHRYIRHQNKLVEISSVDEAISILSSIKLAEGHQESPTATTVTDISGDSLLRKNSRILKTLTKEEIAILRAISHDGVLQDRKVNMPIDIGPIPTDVSDSKKLEELLYPHMQTIALLVALHNKFEFDIRYKLVDTVSKNRLGIAQKALEAQLDELVGVDSDMLKDRVRKLHEDDTSVIEAPLLSLDKLKTYKKIPDNTFPVALQNTGHGVPDYVTARSIALTLAASSIRKQSETEGEWRERVEKLYYPRLRDVIQEHFPEETFTLKTLIDMVENADSRLMQELNPALPPAMPMPINEYFKVLHDILRFA
jgi:hypothetical protein